MKNKLSTLLIISMIVMTTGCGYHYSHRPMRPFVPTQCLGGCGGNCGSCLAAAMPCSPCGGCGMCDSCCDTYSSPVAGCAVSGCMAPAAPSCTTCSSCAAQSFPTGNMVPAGYTAQGFQPTPAPQFIVQQNPVQTAILQPMSVESLANSGFSNEGVQQCVALQDENGMVISTQPDTVQTQMQVQVQPQTQPQMQVMQTVPIQTYYPVQAAMPVSSCSSCGSYTETCVDSCPACYTGCVQGPLSWTVSLLTRGMYWGSDCCSNIFWGDWINSPPKTCEPCGLKGDWIGDGCTGCNLYDKGYADQYYGEGSMGQVRPVAAYQSAHDIATPNCQSCSVGSSGSMSRSGSTLSATGQMMQPTMQAVPGQLYVPAQAIQPRRVPTQR